MPIQQTLSIIKPDAVAKNVIGEIYDRFEKAGLRIVAARMEHLSQEKAGAFYAVHKERPFYDDLVEFMTSGSHGRHQSGGCRRGYDPSRFCANRRRKCSAWF